MFGLIPFFWFWILTLHTPDMSFDQSAAAASADHNNIKGVPTHGGRYVQYNIYGNLFEVSRKYVPPIRPVGRGAYGIVW